ncbi:hypothetical protein [Amycolatopsis pigmentata]|uniref:Uncharacterized protein n=1 Tax=Amycolatopsis pigmentata TaxID=450801 RepID=A0ABW5FQQ0_9PSEU
MTSDAREPLSPLTHRPRPDTRLRGDIRAGLAGPHPGAMDPTHEFRFRVVNRDSTGELFAAGDGLTGEKRLL